MTKENLILKLAKNINKTNVDKKPYEDVSIDVLIVENNILVLSGESEEETRRHYMHLMYRDGESSTSYEEEFDDYADNTEQTDKLEPPKSFIETDHEKLQEKIEQSKKELNVATEIIENELK